MTFAQLSARLKNFLRGWLLVLGLKEGLVECATVCVKSVVILIKLAAAFLRQTSVVGTNVWRGAMRVTGEARAIGAEVCAALHRIEVKVGLVGLPFALPQSPAGNDPE